MSRRVLRKRHMNVVTLHGGVTCERIGLSVQVVCMGANISCLWQTDIVST